MDLYWEKFKTPFLCFAGYSGVGKTTLVKHLIKKSNMQFVNHGRDGLVESYFLQDHHTLLHILVSKRVDTLTLMYQNLKFNEEIDEYLTIKRTFYYE